MSRVLKRLAKTGLLRGLDADTIEKLMTADAPEKKDTGWRTTEKGDHYHIGKGGEIDKGPKAMKGSNINKPSTWASKSEWKATKAGSAPAKPKNASNPESQEEMRKKLHNMAWQYSQYSPQHTGERKELLEKWNDNVRNAEAAGISHKEMNEIFHKPDVDIARKYEDEHEDEDEPKLSEPAGVKYNPFEPKDGSGGYKAPERLSPVHYDASVAKRDTKMQEDFAKVSSDREGMEKLLDGLPAGAMLRYNERGYSLFVKQEDGSWTYQNAFSSQANKSSTDEIFKSVQEWRDPKTGKKDPTRAIQGISVPKEGEKGRSLEWDSRRAVANLEPNAGDLYTGKKVTLREAMNSPANEGKFPKEEGNASAEYTKVVKDENGATKSAGAPAGKLKQGTGVTRIDRGDILKTNPDDMLYNTLSNHCVEREDGSLVLTPEREKLHQDIIQETFAKANPVKPGEKKVFTMLGGGSAAGKGTIQKNMPELFNQDSPVIDADEMKKRIPEYVDTAFSQDHEKAASLAHEESSALAKRAMQAAFANGYNCTLDGTGDGSPASMKKKILEAQANGYTVEGVYVTCPTELAVERNENRSKTDEYNRLVNENAVRNIHAEVSHIFPIVAPLMDHVVLYDSNRKDKDGKPLKIAECHKGEQPKPVPGCEKYYQEFLDKELEKAEYKEARENRKK